MDEQNAQDAENVDLRCTDARKQRSIVDGSHEEHGRFVPVVDFVLVRRIAVAGSGSGGGGRRRP